MRLVLIALISFFTSQISAQQTGSLSSSELLLQLRKLEVHGSVLYIAAHPDDENTRLLSYLSNERLLRTGYLSLTRGDGGQNLIGDEQGVDLGLIRTQELLAARRVDGAEQFFTRAYDFGFSKSPDEAFGVWGHDKILSDVVWVIRTFKPDIIITRFPTTGEGGHGHHTASAILASEAFDAAADPTKFPEQFQHGATSWQAKRLLWNTFNFGNNNTTRENQFKVDVGGYNPLLGKSYGEMAAISRSYHKSQGFGVPAQRGTSFEYFTTIKGSAPVTDLLDGVDITSDRISFIDDAQSAKYKALLQRIIANFHPLAPAASVNDLQALYTLFGQTQGYLGDHSRQQVINKLIADAAGLFMEVSSPSQQLTIGDTARFTVTVNNRAGVPLQKARVYVFNKAIDMELAGINQNSTKQTAVMISAAEKAGVPYWIQDPMNKGSFSVNDQKLIGVADASRPQARVEITINGIQHQFYIPVVYKSTDPVQGETYQPVHVVEPFSIDTDPPVLVFTSSKPQQKSLKYSIQANKDIKEKISFSSMMNNKRTIVFDSVVNWKKGETRTYSVNISAINIPANTWSALYGQLESPSIKSVQRSTTKKISYPHIPDILYSTSDGTMAVNLDLITEGTNAGYIPGAGDRIPEALVQMGYSVTILGEEDINETNLKRFDVIITGIRAYNIHNWLSSVYPILMKYVSDGGVLLSQYNTNNSIGPIRARISPYPFTISRSRITDETAKVNFLVPAHPVFNHPNKITEKDFENWIQERSIYHAEGIDTNYVRLLSMSDPGENAHDGSLIVAPYGKGRFVYTGLVFFRQLPAAVPGAYRLFANIIANKRK